MTATHTKKNAKYTYAERVVGALSQIQREQKKHSIHQATLRAQVRKNAEARKDALGPQWSSWVSRAVNKLEGQGILEVPEPGYIAFTPNAKKTITTARRELADAPTTPRSKVQEYHVVKSVTQLSASCGVKRRRRSSIWTLPPDSDDEDLDKVRGTQSKVSAKRNRLSNKRARRQSEGVPSRWTKAELLERYHQLEQARLADIHNLEEVARLREELASARRNLEGFSAQRQEDMAMVADMSCQTPTRPRVGRVSTFPTLLETPASSPMRPHLANVISGRRPIQGVIRTESGSLIDHYSKRPTPAPSTPGPDAGMEDPFDYSGRDHSMHDSDDPSSAPHGLATPTATPFIERLTLLPSPINLETRREMSTLRTTVEVHESELRTLRQTHGELVEERAKLQTLLSSRSADVETLRAELEERTTAMCELQKKFAAANAANTSLEITEANLHEVLRSTETELGRAEFELRIKGSLLRSLLTEKEELGVQVANHNDSLAALKTACESRLNSVAEEKAELYEKLLTAAETENSLREDLEARSVRVTELDSHCQDLETRCASTKRLLDETNPKFSQLKDQFDAIQHDLVKISDERTQALSDSENVKRELSRVRITMGTLQQDLKSAKDTITEKEALLVRQTQMLNELQDRERALASEGVSLNATIAMLQTQITEKNTTIEGLRGDAHATTERLRSLETAMTEKNTTIAELRGIQFAASEQASALVAQLQAMESKQTELDCALNDARSRIDDKTSEVNILQSKMAVQAHANDMLTKDLALANAASATLTPQLQSKTAEVASLQANVAKVQSAVRELQVKMDLLEKEKTTEAEALLTQLSLAQESLHASEVELGNLRLDFQVVQSEKTRIEAALKQCGIELTAAHSALQAEAERAEALQLQLKEALYRAENAETEADELREAKFEDEQNITALKEAFEHLRKLQLENLAGAERKIMAAKSSPMPSHRRSSVVPGKHAAS